MVVLTCLNFVLRVFNSLPFAESKPKCRAAWGPKAEILTFNSFFSSLGQWKWRPGREGMGWSGEKPIPHIWRPATWRAGSAGLTPPDPDTGRRGGVGVVGGGTRSGCIWWQLSQSVSSAPKQVAFGPELVKMTHGRLGFSCRSVPPPPPLLLDGASRTALRSLKRVERCAARGGWEMLGWGPTAGNFLSSSTCWSKAEWERRAMRRQSRWLRWAQRSQAAVVSPALSASFPSTGSFRRVVAEVGSAQAPGTEPGAPAPPAAGRGQCVAAGEGAAAESRSLKSAFVLNYLSSGPHVFPGSPRLPLPSNDACTPS